MQRRDLNASRTAGSIAAVSAPALIVGSARRIFAHRGMRPQRTSEQFAALLLADGRLAAPKVRSEESCRRKKNLRAVNLTHSLQNPKSEMP